MIATVETIGLLHAISPLFPISFKIGNMIHMMAVVGTMKKMGLESPSAVAAQAPVIEIVKRTVKNASVTLPAIHTRPGLEG
jgi:hypothetical protein